MSSIHYKLKNQVGSSVVTFDGPYITFENLKREVLHRIASKASDLDVQIFNEQSGQGERRSEPLLWSLLPPPLLLPWVVSPVLCPPRAVCCLLLLRACAPQRCILCPSSACLFPLSGLLVPLVLHTCGAVACSGASRARCPGGGGERRAQQWASEEPRQRPLHLQCGTREPRTPHAPASPHTALVSAAVLPLLFVSCFALVERRREPPPSLPSPEIPSLALALRQTRRGPC